MEKVQTKGNANVLSAKIKETWNLLTDEDISHYHDRREQFYDKLKEKYGLSKEAAEIKVSAIEKSCGCVSTVEKAA